MHDDIEALLDVTLKKLSGFDRLDRKWFAEAVLDDLNCVYGVGDATDPIEAVRDVGEGFVQAVALAAQRHPERLWAVYEAAHGVLMGLLELVPESMPNRAAGRSESVTYPA